MSLSESLIMTRSNLRDMAANPAGREILERCYRQIEQKIGEMGQADRRRAERLAEKIRVALSEVSA